MLRVVMLTNGQVPGLRILNALERRGVRPLAVLLLGGGPLGAMLPAGGWRERAAGLPRGLARWGVRNARAHVLALRIARRYRVAVRVAGPMNGAPLLRALHRLRPDVLVLGGGGILGQPVIDAARLGVLNAHPGLLPWLRGNGVVGHALAHGVAVGVTVHRVNRLIDGGAVVERRLLPVNAAGPLRELQDRTSWLAAETMADVVAEIVRSGEMPAGLEQAARRPLLRWYGPERHAELDALARAGRAAELFAAWKPLCSDAATWRLPLAELAPEGVREPA